MGESISNLQFKALQPQTQQQEAPQQEKGIISGLFDDMSKAFGQATSDVRRTPIMPYDLTPYGAFGFGGFGIFGCGCCSPMPFIPINSFCMGDSLAMQQALGFQQALKASVQPTSEPLFSTPKFGDFSFLGLGQSQPTQTTQPKQEIKNKADAFDKIDDAKMSELTKLEEELQAAKAEFDKAPNDEAKAKAYNEKRTAYQAAQKGLDNGAILSSVYGDTFKFGNLGAKERAGIKSQNSEIKGLKEKLTALTREKATLDTQIAIAKQTLKAQGKAESDLATLVPQANIDKAESLKTQIDELEKEVNSNIELLSKFVKSAGADGNDNEFECFKANQ